MGVELVLDNFINGEFVASRSSAYIDSYEPSTGDVWARIPDSSVDEVNQAVQAAKQAFKTWRKTTVKERVTILTSIADHLEQNAAELSMLSSRDLGMPVGVCKGVDIPKSVSNFRFFAMNIQNQNSKSRVFEPDGAIEYVHHHPVGVAGIISPWNLPLGLLTFKLAAAIAWGNCVVCKPSETTSVVAWKMCSLLNDAGVPAGVVNMVFGSGAVTGDALVRHPDVPLICFIGGTAIGAMISQACASMFKKLSLELGGKNPAIVFNDADLEKCISICVKSSFSGQGQFCLASSRIFVQRSVYDTFLKTFVESTRKLKVGDPKDGASSLGPLGSKEHKAKVTSYIDLALQGAGRVVCGHGVDSLDLPENIKHGYFMLPTVITDTPDDGRLMQEEIFGPVTCIVPFDTEEEVIARANNVEFGLTASVFTSDVSRAHRVSKQIEAGTVWVNSWMLRDYQMPFGGFKSSGLGRQGADHSKDFFTEAQVVCIQI